MTETEDRRKSFTNAGYKPSSQASFEYVEPSTMADKARLVTNGSASSSTSTQNGLNGVSFNAPTVARPVVNGTVSQNGVVYHAAPSAETMVSVPPTDGPFCIDDESIQYAKPGLWQERSFLEKVLILILLFALLALLCLVALLVAQKDRAPSITLSHPMSGKIQKENFEVCTTSGCVSAAADILAAMDQSVDPCTDFFTYACGQWNELHPIPEDEAGYGTFRMVRDKLRIQLRALLQKNKLHENHVSKSIHMAHLAYDGCMNEEAIVKEHSSPLWAALNDLGGWPLLRDTAKDPETIDLSHMLGILKRDFACDAFLSVYVYADGKDTTKNVLYIDQGSLGLQARDYYLNQSTFHRQMNGYRNLMKGTITLLAEDNHVEVPDDLDAWIEKLINFETTLANLTSPEAKRRNATRMYNKWPIRELAERVPEIDWMKYLGLVLPPEVMSAIDEDTEVIVQEPEYVALLATLLKTQDKETVVNSVFWRIVKLWSKVLDTRYEDLLQDFLLEMLGRQQKPPRWKSCVMAAVSWFDMAMGSLYVTEHFDTNDKNEALAMIENLQKAFETIVKGLDWMDEETKQTAVEKAEAMILHIGYPPVAKNITALDEYYKDLHINEHDSYFMVAKKIAVWQQNRELKELLNRFDREKFDISPAVVNAFYSPEKNAITFPAGILQPPFFRGDYPKSVNYGAMGAVIGHEITHGFDDQGSQYDKNGNLHNWWSPTAFDGFYNRTQCMIKQYSSYVVPDIEMPVNGILTQGENIADNGGIKESFLAYKNYVDSLGKEEPRLPGLLNLTNDQIFYLSFANFWCGHKKTAAAVQQVLTDPHSPEMFRVIGVMTNSEEFAKAYNCVPGTKMNPPVSDKSKCDVW